MKKTEKLKSILICEEVHTQMKVYASKQGKMMKPIVEEIISDFLKKQQ